MRFIIFAGSFIMALTMAVTWAGDDLLFNASGNLVVNPSFDNADGFESG